MRTRALRAAAVVAALLIGVTLGRMSAPSRGQTLASAQDAPRLTRSQQIDEWKRAVEQHARGSGDQAAILVAAWSRETLTSVLEGVLALGRQGDINDLLTRGATLHGDIGVRLRAKASGPLNAPPGLSGGTSLSLDGMELGNDALSFHLDFARALLDGVRPRPSSSDDVRRWYRSVAAQLAQIYNLAESLPHLRRARQIFPNDADLLFASGCLYETFQAPRVRAAVESLTFSATIVPGPESSRSEAARYFRRALTVDPGLVEAQVRLARVLGTSGTHRSAATLLQKAIPNVGADKPLAYYAWLFLGDEHQALRDFGAAGAAYRRAADLFPGAQSSQLALSLLARRLGDRRAALDAIDPALSNTGQPLVEDPWWRYFEGPGRRLPPVAAPFRLALASNSDR